MPAFMPPLTLDTADAEALALRMPQITPTQIAYHIMQSSPLAMQIDEGDLHKLSSDGSLCALDWQVAATIWCAILRIARTILLAANPGMTVRSLRPVIPDTRLEEIDMPMPFIIKALDFTQNPCLLSGTPQEIIARFRYIQQLGVDGLRWLIHAKFRCARVENGWQWGAPPSQTFNQHPLLADGPVVPMEHRSLDHFDAPANTERAVIIHPVVSHAATIAGTNALVPYQPRQPYFAPEDNVDDDRVSIPGLDTPLISPWPSQASLVEGSEVGDGVYRSQIDARGGYFRLRVQPHDADDRQDYCESCNSLDSHDRNCYSPLSDYSDSVSEEEEKSIDMLALDDITYVDGEGRVFIDLTGEEDD